MAEGVHIAGRAEAGATPPLRTCIVSRESRPPEHLIRFVASPDGTIVADLARRLPGRGVWITADRAMVAEAVRKNLFAKSLKRQVTASPDLAEEVDRLLVRRLIAALSLANKAGMITTGFTKIEAALAAGRVAALLHAAEASPDGAGKLDRRMIAMAAETGRKAQIIRDLTVEQLSLALGRANVVHAALGAGGATTNFLNEASRVTRYRSGSPVLTNQTTAS